MRINKNTQITGDNVILVPYKKKHVPRYHEWMKSPELQHFTASMPLSLDEEYQMQKSWLRDEDKCTFIILDKSTFLSTGNEIDSMIGDTNLFFNDVENPTAAEAEIMIAETRNRGKRRGWESMILMLRYGVEELRVSRYTAKISLDNETSIRMFRKLSFEEVSRSEVFEELTLKRDVDDDWLNWLRTETTNSRRENRYLHDDDEDEAID